MVQFLQVNGRAYTYEEQGQGPLVLFGHGMLFNRAMFRHQAAALQGRFRCVRFDWPGHGETVAGDEPWTADNLVTDVRAIE